MGLFFSVTLCIVLAILLFLQHQRHKLDIDKLKDDFNNERAQIRKDAAFKSSAINWGMTIENFVPFMDEFPVPSESAIFMGKPIDYVSFTDTDDPEKCAVHIIEVKSGKSQLLKHQRHIRDAIKKGKVHWHEIRVESNVKK
jgi:predicted Holliday junction resolvase-like endonuclease